MTTLEHAHKEWASRADDERFSSIADMHAVAMRQRTQARVAKLKASALAVTGDHDDLRLSSSTGKSAALTNWSFGQLARIAKAPADYLTTLPASISAECITHGLRTRAAGDDGKDAVALMQEGDDGITCRAITSESYSRIWNADITSRLLELEAAGPWQPAPAAFDGSRGLYLSDRDMFAFLVDNNRRIFETGPGGGLARGFFIGNSEVGARKFFLMSFLYEYVCGNHRVWGAQEVEEVSVIHIGHDQSKKAFDLMEIEMKKYAEASAGDDELRVAQARAFQIGASKKEVVDAIFALKFPGLGRGVIEKSYDQAEKRVDWYGSPRTAWGLAGGMTEIARDLPNADARHALDRAGNAVMQMAW